MVMSNAVEGTDAEFNKWYDEVHVTDVLAVPGVVSAQRFTLSELTAPEVEGTPPPPPPAHRYLAVYELERDPNEVMAEFGERMVTGVMVLSPTLDLTTIGLSSWAPLGPRREAGA